MEGVARPTEKGIGAPDWKFVCCTSVFFFFRLTKRFTFWERAYRYLIYENHTSTKRAHMSSVFWCLCLQALRQTAAFADGAGLQLKARKKCIDLIFTYFYWLTI